MARREEEESVAPSFSVWKAFLILTKHCLVSEKSKWERKTKSLQVSKTGTPSSLESQHLKSEVLSVRKANACFFSIFFSFLLSRCFFLTPRLFFLLFLSFSSSQVCPLFLNIHFLSSSLIQIFLSFFFNILFLSFHFSSFICLSFFLNAHYLSLFLLLLLFLSFFVNIYFLFFFFFSSFIYLFLLHIRFLSPNSDFSFFLT